jgi:hypothetical protein
VVGQRRQTRENITGFDFEDKEKSLEKGIKLAFSCI